MSNINCEALLAALEVRGVSRRRLARELDISRSTVLRILAGENRPSHFIAQSITETLDLSEEECLDIFFPRYAKRKEKLSIRRP